MTIIDPKVSQFLGIPYPSEECDPFYDQFEGMILTQEQILFYNKMFGNMFLTGGGTRTWIVGSSSLTWTSDFIVPVPHWGRKITIPYGPDGLTRSATLQDGQALVIKPPMSLSANIALNFQVASQLNVTEHNNFVCGIRIGNAVYLRGIGELV